MPFSIKDLFSKYDQIRSFLRLWSHLLKKYLIENFIFCAAICETVVTVVQIVAEEYLWHDLIFFFQNENIHGGFIYF